MFRFNLLLLLFFSALSCVSAQDREISKKPSAILFMLHISTNKIEALQKRGLQQDVKDVIQADFEINNSIVRDFEMNFKYCPVYFFYDTQLNYVLKRQWEKVEFYDFEHYKTNKKIEVSSLDNYLIAEVSYPPITQYPEIIKEGVAAMPEYVDEYVAARDYGILSSDPEYKLLPNKLKYTNISLHRVGNMFEPKTLQYRFVGARIYEQKLKKYFAQQR